VTPLSRSTDWPFPVRHIAQVVFLAFVLTFITARVITFLIMAHRIPDLYLHLGGTHVHHLNYGIFLLAGVGAYLLFWSVSPQALLRAGVVYGVGLALTFDEFGMWLHLGGSYWQRASFDAIIVLAGVLGLVSIGPPLQRGRPRPTAAVLLTLGATLVFFALLAESFRFAERVAPRMQQLEQDAPR
jgi:hypothetical protein